MPGIDLATVRSIMSTRVVFPWSTWCYDGHISDVVASFSWSIHSILNTVGQTSPLDMTACIMEHLHISQFLGILVVMLVAAKASGIPRCSVAGQPAVLR